MYVDLTLERVAKLQQFCNIRWTYHMQTKQDSERRAYPTLAPKLYVEHVIIHIVLRPDRTSSHRITSFEIAATSIHSFQAIAPDIMDHSHHAGMDHGGHMGHGDMDHGGDMGPMCSMNVSCTPPPPTPFSYHPADTKPQYRCSSPGTQPTSASSSPAGA
jgi:hypothetical protein